MFVLLLMTATHVLLNLWVAGTVRHATADAATAVARSGARGVALAAVESEATARALVPLGRFGHEVRISFSPGPDPDSLVVSVHAPPVGVVPAALAAALGTGGIDDRFVVHLEPPPAVEPVGPTDSGS